MSADDPPLDLARLDRAIGPVRRVVGYAMRTDALPAFLEANTRRHLAAALGLGLPQALHDVVAAVAEHATGFDAAEAEEKYQRLSGMYAGLNRIDAITGLPLPAKRLKAIAKPVQRDEPEPAPMSEQEVDREPVVAEAREEPKKGGRAARKRSSEKPSRPVRPKLGDDVSTLVEPAVAEALEAAGIQTLEELLWTPPRRVSTLEVHSDVQGIEAGERVAVGGRVARTWSVLRPDGGRACWSMLSGAAPVRVRWADQIAADALPAERGVVAVGTLEDGALHDAVLAVAEGGQIHVATYGIDGVSEPVMRDLVARLLPRAQGIADPVPPKLLQSVGLPSRGAALKGLHLGHEEGRRRQAYDEALLVQLAGMTRRRRGGRGLPHKIVHGLATGAGPVDAILLDDDQQRCFEEIKRSLRRPNPMRHVLTGEVGSGKGAVALRAITMVAEGRSQVLVLADDEVGAAERYLHTEPVLREAGLVAKHLVAPPTGSQRDALRRGEIHVTFGTPELLEHELEFRRLGLVVATERERFGRAADLCDALPAPKPDLLTITSLPVGPQVLFTAYASHHVDVLTDALRTPARIDLIEADQRDGAYTRVRDVVAAGEQAVIVFPMVSGRDALDVREALRVVRALQEDALEGLRVGLFHGSMPGDERRRVHLDLVHRRLDVLVSTTRLEEGPRIPGLGLVVVEQAESVDAWRLHRIIGFLSRPPGEVACTILVAGSLASPDAKARLERLMAAPSGTALTELRVLRQGLDSAVSGGAPWPSLAWLDLERDLQLVVEARQHVQAMARIDPALRNAPATDLIRELSARWSTLWPEADPETWPAPTAEGSSGEGRRRRRRRRRRR